MKKKLLLSFFSLFSFLGYAQLPLEGFEGTFPPTNWAVFDINVGGTTDWSTNPNSCQETLAAYMNRQNIAAGVTSEEYLATRLVTVPANGELRFFSRTFTAGNQGTTYEVKLALGTSAQNLPASYTTTLATYTEDQLSAVFNVCDEKVIDLTAFQGQDVYIAFVMKYTQPTSSLSGDRWLLDNVQVIEKCLDPTAQAAAPLATSSTLSWLGSGVTFDIEHLPAAGVPTGTPTGSTSTNSFNQTGLTPNTNYCYYVRAVCTDSSSAWVGPFCYSTSTLPPVCGGNYVDSGGTTANYPANADETVTICPITPGDVVTVTFTAFNTEASFDGMYVYNGSVIDVANQIASANGAGFVPGGVPGSFWGNTIPGPFTSSAADGCLTFRFRSDGIINLAGWIANVTCGPPPTCPSPTGLSVTGVLSTTANATWTSNSTATTYNLIALPCGSPAPNAGTTGYQTSLTSTNAPITGLSPDTCYDIYVRDECSPTDFSNWISVTNIITQPIPPACGGTFTDPGGANANYANGLDSTVTICPTVPGEVVTVTFTAFNTETNWDGLYVYNSNTLTNQISSGNPAGNVPGGVPGAFWGNTIPGPFTSSDPSGCLTFRFRSDGSVNLSGWVANITCGLPPTCPTPNSLAASTITSNSVNLTWTSNSTATTFNMIAVPCGSPAPDASTTGYQTSSTNINALLNGLSPDTCYDIYVRDECAADDFSIWIGITNITTQIAPPVCGGTFTDPGGATNNYANNTNYNVTICPTIPGQQVTVTFTFFNTETNWDGLYVYDGNSTSAPQIASTNGPGFGPSTQPGAFWGTTIPGPFTSSSADGCLTFNFLSDGSVNNPGWIADVTCGPPPTCRKPTDLDATAVALTTATLEWTQLQNPDGSTATAWEVLILPAGSPAPNAGTPGWIASPTNPFSAVGLTEATCYDYYVRAVCSPTDSSLWAGPFNFCTLIPNDDCDGAITVLTNPDQSCTNFSNGSLIGATPSTQLNNCAGQATEDVWFQFVATSQNHSVNLNNIVGNQFDLGFATYEGTCPGALTQIGCQPFGIDDILNNLTIGQTYFIRVFLDSFATNQNITFEVCVGTIPPAIITNDTQFTNVELVEDVLFNSTCASVTNVTTSTGSNFGSVNGIGYFNRNGSSFPFEDGVVLTSGSITNVPGPNTTQSSDGNQAWVGDNDLNAIIAAATGQPMNSRNASIMEFDFIPLVDNISFDFIFASEEYGTFQCTFSDAFAFLLTNLSTGVTTNLAVVPGTPTPISVVTIRDNAFNNGCPSVNEQYFADFYGPAPGLNVLGSPTNFNGSTIPMTASSLVTPGQQYHIKLVVADRQDNILDSAVFLEGGSFNFGLELGIDFLISGGNALCAGTTNQLVSDLDPALYTFVWSNQNGVIPGETGPNLLINQTGTYTLVATLINTTCTATDTIIVEYYDPITLATPNNLTACNSTGFAQFTLNQNNASVLGVYPAAQHTVTYHLTQADATAGVNPLPNLYTNVVAFSQTIYARVTNVAGCFGTSQFNLIVQDLTPQFTLTPEQTICSGSSGTISVTPSNFNLGDATYSWTFNTNPLPDTTSSISVGQAGTYTVTVNNSGCTATASTSVLVIVCDISMYASAVWMEDCTTPGDGKFFNTTGSGADLINQDGSVFSMNYGVHVQNSATLLLRGAELKTQKSASSNVCDARMNYRVFPTGNTPGTFTPWNLPFYSDCNTGTGTFDVGGGPCTTGQQKWQCVSQPGCTAPLDLTTLAPGNYTIQVYYDINGSFTTTTGCTDNLTLDNGGNYYEATFTIQAPALISSTDPLTCNGNNGTITISNLVPNQSYTVTYNDDTTPVGPVTLTANANGEIIINGLNAGAYTNFNFNVNGCDALLTSGATLVDPGLPVVTVNSEVICNGASTTITATPAIPGNYNYVWTVPAGFPNPGNVASFATNVPGDYTVVITPIVTTTFCNLDFETPTVTGTFPTLVNDSLVPCWDTTASDGIMEFWPSPNYENVLAYQGSQFIEMNGNFPATIFQDFTVEPGSTLNISFAHRGRQGNDTVGVEIGPIGGPYVNLGSFTDGNTAWVLQNVSYIIPLNGGTNYSLRFVSISSAGGSASVGNYLDAVSITTVQCSSLPTTGTVSLLPNVTLTLTSSNENQNVCINTAIVPIVYTTVNATDVTVAGLPNGVSSVFNAGDFTISGTPSEAGTFNYTVTTIGGCTVETATGTLVVNPDSTLVLSNGSDIQNLCINTAISAIEYTSTAASDVTVTGLPNGVTGTFNAGVLTISGTPTESGVFNYSVTTVSTCATVTLNGTITVNPDVTLTLTSANENQSICINTPLVAIVYSSTGTTDVTVVGLPNGVTGTYNSGVFTISGSPSEVGTFNYSVSTVGTCGNASLTGTIIVNPNATLSLSSGNDAQNLCINTPITSIVYQSGNGATGITVSGLPTGVTSTLAGDLLTISGTPTVAGTFTYTVSTTGGCGTATLTGTIVVTNVVTPTFNFGTSLVLCPGSQAPLLPTTSANSITGTWSPTVIDTATSGTYTFTPDANQCANTTTLTVTVQSAFNFTMDGDCQANSFVLFAEPIDNGYDENTASYSWVFNGNVVSTDPEFNVTAYVNSTNVTEELPLVFTLTITRPDGCSNTNSYTVTRIYCDIQNGISPNDDGKNEFFDLSTFNVRKLNIYNRYGTIVYSKGNYTTEWRGQSDAGEELPDGTYYYVIEFNDNQAAKTGWIYINRQKR